MSLANGFIDFKSKLLKKKPQYSIQAPDLAPHVTKHRVTIYLLKTAVETGRMCFENASYLSGTRKQLTMIERRKKDSDINVLGSEDLKYWNENENCKLCLEDICRKCPVVSAI